jgi:hypothetical protein
MFAVIPWVDTGTPPIGLLPSPAGPGKPKAKGVNEFAFRREPAFDLLFALVVCRPGYLFCATIESLSIGADAGRALSDTR